MKINWKVRFKNEQFVIMILLAIAAPVSAYFNVSGQDINTWGALFGLVKDVVSNPFVLFSIAVGVYNAVLDPTTKGIKDSEQAQGYNKPKE